MKTLKWIIAIVLLLAVLKGRSQNQERQPSNQFRNDPADTTSVVDPSDDASGPETDTTQVTDASSDNGNNAAAMTDKKTSAPVVNQTTSSESGSPAMPASEEGRDGTNNVQRAKPNIAGAEEVGNMDLEKKNLGEKNVNTGNKRIQKQEEVPQATEPEQPVESVQSADSTTQNDEVIYSYEAPEKSKKELRREKRKERRKNRE